jgi:hypothetical protein
LLETQRPDEAAVLNADDPESRRLESFVRGRVYLFSTRAEVDPGAFVRQGRIVLRDGTGDTEILAVEEIPVPGEHNLANALAAAIACRLAGTEVATIAAGLRSFRALPHRLEYVATFDGIAFYNDSKATNLDAAVRALRSFPRGSVHVILGGKDKGADWTSLAPVVREQARRVLLVGDAAATIRAGLSGTVPLVDCGTVRTAVREGFEDAVPGDVVLWLPAASFDQYRTSRREAGPSRRGGSALPEGGIVLRPLAFDRWLFATTAALTVFGLFMVGSASFYRAASEGQGAVGFLLKLVLHVVAGALAFAVTLRLPYHKLDDERRVGLLVGACLILLFLVLAMPPVGGARRWFRLGGLLAVQPSEFAKLAAVAFMAHLLSRREHEVNDLWKVPFPALLVVRHDALIPSSWTSGGVHIAVTALVMIVAGAASNISPGGRRGPGGGARRAVPHRALEGVLREHAVGLGEGQPRRRVPAHPVVDRGRQRRPDGGRLGTGPAEGVLPSGGAHGFHLLRRRRRAGARRSAPAARGVPRDLLAGDPDGEPRARPVRLLPRAGHHLHAGIPGDDSHGGLSGAAPHEGAAPSAHQPRRLVPRRDHGGGGRAAQHLAALELT